MTSPLFSPLADVRQRDMALVGGKAATLGELHRAGFPVPAGLCVTTTAFHLALAEWQPQIQRLIDQADVTDPATVQATALAIAELLAGLSIPPELDDVLATSLPQSVSESAPLAVRSSATGEDGATTSYAGHYATSLGVHGPALQAAILAGWRSFYCANALAARAMHGELATSEGMALLIQPLLAAECAGVALSVDPVQARRDRLVVNAAWGLGVGVVDGDVANDTIWVRRADLAVDQQQIVEKADAFTADVDGNLFKISVPQEQQRAACLPPAWLERVAQFTIAVETHLGAAQDIEWAVADGRLWLLQARPITGLPTALARPAPFPVTWQNEEQCLCLWRHERPGDEQKADEPDVQRPLLLDNALDIASTCEEGCRLLGAERNQAINTFNGRVYVCDIPMPWSAADQRIRRVAMLDLRARLQEQGLTAWDHWGPEIVAATERLRGFDRDGADGPALADHLEEVLAVRRRHLPLHPAMSFEPSQRYYDAFSALSGLVGDEAASVANRLVDSEETPLTQLIDELYALASLARLEPAVAALVTKPPVDCMRRLAAQPAAESFLTQLTQFLDRYGERTGDGWGSEVTLSMPTWREEPAIVLTLIAPYLDPHLEAPAHIRRQARRRREAEVATLSAACADSTIVAEFRHQLAYARKVSAVVEQHNHYLDQTYSGQLRQAVVAAGRWLVRQYLINAVDEVFWFNFAEIDHALRTPATFDAATIIAARQADDQVWQTMETPPILGMPSANLPPRPAWRDEVLDTTTNVEAAKPGELQGIGASHGFGRGRACITTDPYILPDLKPGDILVAVNVGPMWTPLFPILGGLVLEKGSVGQHAAATAREYGVPVAIQVKDACHLIADGRWITVNGQSGAVELVD